MCSRFHACSGLALAVMVLGSGALAQTSSVKKPIRIEAVPQKGANVEVELELVGERGDDRPAVAQLELPESGKRMVKKTRFAGASDYVIGVSCSPVDAPLRAQLHLKDNTGLLVDQVVADSPAAKAGLKQFDVIVDVSGKSVSDQKVLGDIVQSAKGAKLTLSIVRGGKPETITVAPSKREPVLAFDDGKWEAELSPADRDVIVRWLERGPDRFRMHAMRPGVVVDKGSVGVRKLPKNVSIYVKKSGDQPAGITIERDGKKWDVTEDKLDDLPKDLRGHVEGLLGRAPGGDFFLLGEGSTGAPSAKLHMVRKKIDEAIRDKGDAQIEKRLDELNDKLEKLQRAVDGLRQQPPRN